MKEQTDTYNLRDKYWDRYISFYVIYYFIASALNATIKHIFPISGELSKIVSVAVGVSIVFFMAISMREVWRRSARILVGTVLIFLSLYAISICQELARGNTISYLLSGSVFLTFAWWIPVGVYASSVKNREILYNTCLYGSYFISILMFLMWFKQRADINNEYSMFMGFALIMPLLFHINEFMNKQKWWFLLLSIAETLMILLFANRGVLLSVVTFVVYKIVTLNNSSVRKYIYIILVIAAGVLGYIYLDEIVTALLDVCDFFGYDSRTLRLILSESLDDTSGRTDIWAICFNMIDEKPLFGWGLGGEFNEIAYRFRTAQDEAGIGFSPHNGIIQNFVNFGIIGGLLANLVILLPLLFPNRIKDAFSKDTIAVFVYASIIPCLVSADGFFTKPAVAIVLFLYYRNLKHEFD